MKYPVVHKKIPKKLYREMHASLPIACVDLVITDGKKFFLVKRKNKPEAGKWWLVGGRVRKNERLHEAAARLLRTETGLKSPIGKLLGYYEYFASPGYFPGVNAHTLAFVFEVKIKKNQKVLLDSQSSHAKWFASASRSWHPYLKMFLKKKNSKPRRIP